ncbi:MAG: type IX secretion system outer membrane channel protein PorV [Bacteroidales bacterium]|nr:type IX secretion system outer membrane channel protein PorV [Bacteroidales bacterium]
MKTQRFIIAALLLMGASLFSQAQHYQKRYISTAVPFLTIAPDVRGASLGFSGVATSPDAFSMFYNPAKYAFMKNDRTMIATGFSAFSSVASRQILLYDAFAQKIGKSAIAATARYNRSGEIDYLDENDYHLISFRPREFAIDVAYSYRFSDYFSAGIAGRFIHSNLKEGMTHFSAKSYSIAGDLSAYYKRPLGSLVDMSLGAAITNIGTKMAYYSSLSEHEDFVPTTLRLGTGFQFNIHPKHTLTLNLEFSKLLVPTPPIIEKDENDEPLYNNDGAFKIKYGYDGNVSALCGMFQSFYDAPGYALNYATWEYDNIGWFYEELCEINTGMGLEYNLADHFFVRSGFYHVPRLKGGVNCLTEGLGIHFGIFGMDLSYSFYFWMASAVTNDQFMNSHLRWNMYFSF